MGLREAGTEAGTHEVQLFLDTPRSEPRVFPGEKQHPDDLHDSSVIKDKAVCTHDIWNGLVFMRPLTDGAYQPFETDIRQGVLTVKTNSGQIVLCYADEHTLRIRGQGSGIRFYAPLLDHEAAVDRLDHTYQVCIEATCEFLFVPVQGSASMNNPWSLWHGGSEKLLLDILPDQDGTFDVAVHMVPSSARKAESYPPFSDCLQKTRTAYNAWLKDKGREDTRDSFEAWVGMAAFETEEQRVQKAEEIVLAFGKEIQTRPILPARDANEYLFSSTGEFDLRAVPFSARGSFLCILESDDDRQLYLSLTRSPEMWSQRLSLVRLNPVLNNTELPYEYDVEPARMIIRTCAGTMECAFDSEHRLHIRGQGIGLKMSFTMQPGETCIPRGGGAWEVAYSVIGHLLFVPRSGSMYCNAAWNHEAGRTGDFVMEWLPSAENGRFDAVVDSDYDDVTPRDSYPNIERCVSDTLADFNAFRARYPVPPEAFRSRATAAAWVVWSHMMGPAGRIKKPVVYMTRTQFTRAFGWQQSFHAMSASEDIHEAWKLLRSMFDFMDEGGQLPDSGGDIGATYRVTKPALQGLATLYLLKRKDAAGLTEKEYADLYEPMARFTNWWLIYRDRNRSGLPQYFHADESPAEYSSMFRAGLPLYSADVAAFVALMAEACGKLAGLLNKPEEEANWNRIAGNIIEKTVSMLWNGERFQGRVAATGEFVKSTSILNLLPVMLGKRLPEEILNTMTARLSSEKEYLGVHGVTMDSMEERSGDGLPRGPVIYLSTLTAVCLVHGGYTGIAREIARRALNLMMEYGFGFLNVKPGDLQDEPVVHNMPRKKFPSATSKWASWPCGCFFILVDILNQQQT